MALRGVVDAHKRRPLPAEMASRQSFDDGTQLGRQQGTSQPTALGVRVAVDARAELQCEARLAGAGAADQRVNRDIDLVIDPRLELSKQVFAADQGEFP